MPGIIVFDSVSSFYAKLERYGEVGLDEKDARGYPLVAGIMSRWLKHLAVVASQNQITVVFTNQLRQKIDAGPFEDPNITSGGKALRFYSTYRLYLRPGSKITKVEKVGSKTKKVVVGKTINGTMTKNKIDPSNLQKFRIPVLFRGGIMQMWCAREFLDTLGMIKTAGAYKRIPAVNPTDKFQEGSWPKYAKKHASRIKAVIEQRISAEALRTAQALADADIDDVPAEANEFSEDE